MTGLGRAMNFQDLSPSRRGGNRLIELARSGGVVRGTRFSSCRTRHVRAGLNYDPFSAPYPVVKTAADAFGWGMLD